MKKLATLAMAAAVLALAAGCSAPATTDEPGTSSAPPTLPYSGSAATDGPKPNKTLWDYQKPVMADKAFYAQARKGTTTLTKFTDDKLTVISQITCASVGNGETSKDVLIRQALTTATGTADGLTATVGLDLGTLLVAGAQNYCPDLQPTLTKIIS